MLLQLSERRLDPWQLASKQDRAGSMLAREASAAVGLRATIDFAPRRNGLEDLSRALAVGVDHEHRRGRRARAGGVIARTRRSRARRSTAFA